MDGTTHTRSTRLSKRSVHTFVDVMAGELIDFIEPKAMYPILGHDRKIATSAEARYCCMLAERRLIVGTVKVIGEARALTSIRVAPTVTVSQVKNVLRLKPPRISICAKSEVVKVLPTTYTHRSSLAAGF